MSQNLPETTPDKEAEDISLHDLLARLKGYAAELRRSWRILVLTCLPLLAWQGYLSLTTPTMYKTQLTFMVDDDTGGSGGILNGILGDFGLGGGENNNDKIVALSQSMRIIRQALFQKSEINGQTDYLANHFIRIQQLHKKDWHKKPENPGQPSLNGFLFTRDSFEQFSRLEYAALKAIYGKLVGSDKDTPIFITRNNQDSGIMTLSLTTQSESLTIALLRAIFEQLSAFYVLSSTEKQQETFEIIKAKSDSLRRLLTGSEYRAAQFREQNNLLMRPTDQLPTERLSREKTMYNIMYGESVKNLELADFALRNKVPYVQAIDLPIPPLTGFGYGKKKALAWGLGLGLTLGALFVIGRKMMRDAVQ